MIHKECPRCEETYFEGDEYCQTCGLQFFPTQPETDYNVIEDGKTYYKVLGIEGITDEYTGIEKLLIGFSKVESVAGGRYFTHSAIGEKLITRLESTTGRHFLQNPEQLKTLDLSLFEKRTIKLNGKETLIYHEREF